MPFLLSTALVSDGKKHSKYQMDYFSRYVPLYGLNGLPGTRSEQEDGNSGNRDFVL
jgi:hypothetical protein